jgi:RNA polymerase sigma-54 factor
LLQGIKLVQRQREFFEKGPGFIKPMTRKQMADELSLHESTISRITGKKNGKFLRCEWGVFPLSYFFNSGLKTSTENELSSETIKFKIQEIIAENREKNPAENLSDSKLTSILNEQGIKIARRTVAKYRAQLGIENSYNRQ